MSSSTVRRSGKSSGSPVAPVSCSSNRVPAEEQVQERRLVVHALALAEDERVLVVGDDLDRRIGRLRVQSAAPWIQRTAERSVGATTSAYRRLRSVRRDRDAPPGDSAEWTQHGHPLRGRRTARSRRLRASTPVVIERTCRGFRSTAAHHSSVPHVGIVFVHGIGNQQPGRRSSTGAAGSSPCSSTPGRCRRPRAIRSSTSRSSRAPRRGSSSCGSRRRRPKTERARSRSSTGS